MAGGGEKRANGFRAVPDVMLDRLLAGDLAPDQQAAIERACAESPELAALLAARREERGAFYVADPPAVFAHRVAVRLAVDETERRPAKRRPWWAILGAPSLAAATLVVVAVSYSQLHEPESPTLQAELMAPAEDEAKADAIEVDEVTSRGRAVTDELQDSPPDNFAVPASEPTGAPVRTLRPSGKPARPVAKGTASLMKEPSQARRQAGSVAKGKKAGPPPARRSAGSRSGGGAVGGRHGGAKKEGERAAKARAPAPEPTSPATPALPPKPAPEPTSGYATPAPPEAAKRRVAAADAALDAEPSPPPPVAAPASRYEERTAQGASEEAPGAERSEAAPGPAEAQAIALAAHLLVQRGDRWQPAGASLGEGDLVSVSVKVSRSGYIAAVGLRADGIRTIYIAPGTEVRGGVSHAGPGKRLTGEGRERIYILFSPESFSTGSLFAGIEGLPARLRFTGQQRTIDLFVRRAPDHPAASSPP